MAKLFRTVELNSLVVVSPRGVSILFICVRVSVRNVVWSWLVPHLLLFATCDSDVLYCPGHWGAGAKHLSMKSSGRFCFLSICLIPGVPTTLLLLLILLLVLLVLFTGAVCNLRFAR